MARPSKSLAVYYKAESALIAAIEIYNKPDFKYREETFAILAINAWELLIKAKVLAENENRVKALWVYEYRQKADGTQTKRRFPRRNRSGNPHTIGLSHAITLLEGNAKT